VRSSLLSWLMRRTRPLRWVHEGSRAPSALDSACTELARPGYAPRQASRPKSSRPGGPVEAPCVSAAEARQGPLLAHAVTTYVPSLCPSLHLYPLHYSPSHCPCWQVGLSAAPPPSAPLPSALPPPVPPPAGAAPGAASAASAGAEACGGRDGGADAAGAAAEAGGPAQPEHGPTAGVVGAAGGVVDAQTVADAVFRQVRPVRLCFAGRVAAAPSLPARGTQRGARRAG
jgi:hypothetical protein